MAGLNRNFVHSALVPVPPLTEQRTIAYVLSKIQAAIETQEKMIVTLRELKQATMAKLFREGLRGEPIKQTEIGEMPESWELTKLGMIRDNGKGFIQTGPFGSQLHASDYLLNGIPVVNPTHILGNRIAHKELPRVGEETCTKLRRHILREGDILFSRRGEIGSHAIVTRDEAGWLCGTGCFLVRIENNPLDNRFVS